MGKFPSDIKILKYLDYPLTISKNSFLFKGKSRFINYIFRFKFYKIIINFIESLFELPSHPS